jgi:hypothetical protein
VRSTHKGYVLKISIIQYFGGFCVFVFWGTGDWTQDLEPCGIAKAIGEVPGWLPPGWGFLWGRDSCPGWSRPHAWPEQSLNSMAKNSTWQPKNVLFASGHLKHPCSVYTKAMLTHLPYSFWEKLGAGFPSSLGPKSFLHVDSAPSCGHYTGNWDQALVINWEGTPKHSHDKSATRERLCPRGHDFKSACSQSYELPWGTDFYDSNLIIQPRTPGRAEWTGPGTQKEPGLPGVVVQHVGYCLLGREACWGENSKCPLFSGPGYPLCLASSPWWYQGLQSITHLTVSKRPLPTKVRMDRRKSWSEQSLPS